MSFSKQLLQILYYCFIYAKIFHESCFHELGHDQHAAVVIWKGRNVVLFYCRIKLLCCFQSDLTFVTRLIRQSHPTPIFFSNRINWTESTISFSLLICSRRVLVQGILLALFLLSTRQQRFHRLLDNTEIFLCLDSFPTTTRTLTLDVAFLSQWRSLNTESGRARRGN